MARARTLVENAFVVLTSDVVNRAATFAVYAMIARYLGAVEVGQLALALALFYAFQVFAAAGVRTIITREVATDPRLLNRHLVSGMLLVTLASAVAVALLAGLVVAIGYARGTAAVVLLLGLALLPYGWSVVCEAVFQASERMRYIAYAQVPVHVVRVLLAYLLLRRQYGVYHVALLLFASHCAVAAVEWWLVLRYLARPRVEPSEDWARVLRETMASALGLAQSARTFLGIDGLFAIGASLNIVLLSVLAGERDVGLYSAANQLLIPITLVYQSVVISVFPTLCRRLAGGTRDVTDVLSRMLAVLLALAMPTTVGLFFLADPALLFLYGEREFLQASTALGLMVWTLVPVALTSVLGQVFLAGSRERVTLRIVAVNLIVGAAAGVILIAAFGLIGAAIATVLTKTISLWQHYRPVSRLVPALSLHEVGWRPAVAAMCMAAYIAVMGGERLMPTVAGAGVLYLGVLAVLTIWTTGGPRRLKAAMSETWLSRRQI